MTDIQKIYHSEAVQSKLRTIVPLALMLVCSPVVILFWYTNVRLDGSFQELFALFSKNGVLRTVYEVWSPVFFGTKTAWMMIATFACIELLLMRIIPGKPFQGPLTPKGNIPVYKANGVACYLL